jgi:hypothetical protein
MVPEDQVWGVLQPVHDQVSHGTLTPSLTLCLPWAGTPGTKRVSQTPAVLEFGGVTWQLPIPSQHLGETGGSGAVVTVALA